MNTVPIVLVMGTLDGVHRGHQALLTKAAERARALDGAVHVAAFVAPPRRFFHPEPGPFLLTTPSEKEILLKRLGVTRVHTVSFDRSLARLSAADFFKKFIVGRWRAAEMVVGPDFAFGRDRAGDGAFLSRQRPHGAWRVHVVAPVSLKAHKVSSARVREVLRNGDIPSARHLLGHPPLIVGTVERGRGLGRRWGVPTANLAWVPDKIYPQGVFAGRVGLPSGIFRGGMMNIGTRPTVGGRRRTVEVHLFDFAGPLAGQDLRVEILAKLRDEKKFSSVEILLDQLKRDERTARLCWMREGDTL